MLFDEASSVEKLPNPEPKVLPASDRAHMEDELKLLKEQQQFLETLMALTEEENKLAELTALMAIDERAAKPKPVYADLSCH